jgi:hypothetical protein
LTFEVVATPIAERDISALRGARRRAYDDFEADLAATGCRAMGYRLTGDHPLASLCVKHLRGADRAVVAFVDDSAWVLLVGPHDEGDVATNIYGRLYELLGIEAPSNPRTKPPCCDESGEPSRLDEIETDAFVAKH